jgi:hypothetical protein
LHGAHDERKADEGERETDTERCVRNVDAVRFEHPAHGAMRTIERGERDTGNGRRQGERNIDDGIERGASGEAVSHEDPGDERARDDVDERRRKRRAESQFERG